MFKSRFLLKFILVGVVVSTILAGLTFVSLEWARKITESNRVPTLRGPFALIVELVDRLPPEKRVEFVQTFKENDRGREDERGPRFIPIWLKDENGRVFQFGRGGSEPQMDEPMLPPPPPPGERHHDRMPPLQIQWKKLSGEPTQYVGFAFFGPRGGPGGPPPLGRGPFLGMYAMLAGTTVLGVALTIIFMFQGLRSQARRAESTITELRNGNLKARIPVSRSDDFAKMALHFNTMAEEIERLIENLRKTESTRKDLLRELAHDLRTPIASIKTLVETTRERAEQLPAEKKRELLTLAEKEADYMSSLVDDLLFLGSVNEPKYRREIQSMPIADLILSESSSIAPQYPDVRFEIQAGLEDEKIAGDPRLLRRLFRNALENAFSYARTKVTVLVSQEVGNQFAIQVLDDGPGLSEDALKSFGQKKFSRSEPKINRGRISVGLGSVIMKSIAESHGGTLRIENRPATDDGQPGGAALKVTLRRA